MNTSLSDSYRYCRSLARRTGRNFYFSFLTLPRRLRHDMCVLYAFMRLTDDIADDERVPVDDRRLRLASWKCELRNAVEGEPGGSPVFPALADIIRRHGIPGEYLEEVVAGVESDLSPTCFRTRADLDRYCYQVAGAVGLCCIHIWGFHDERAKEAAVDCGRAFQLTNILRDLKEDVRNGRVYLPVEELERFECSADDLQKGVLSKNLAELIRFQVTRARGDYEKASVLYDYLERPGRPILTAMLRIYGGLLRQIERQRYDVFSCPIEISRVRKLSIALTSIAGRRFQVDQLK